MKQNMGLIKAAVFNAIGVGHENATPRKDLPEAGACKDRDARKAIEELRINYAILNLADGKGYFIPTFTDEGINQAELYRRMQLARIKSIKKSLRGTEKFLKEARKQQAMQGQISFFKLLGGG